MRGAFVEHAPLVQHAEDAAREARPAQLTAEEQVFGDGHGGSNGQVLIHRLDSGSARVDRILEVGQSSVEEDLTGIGDQCAGERLDERGFARAVVADYGEDLARTQVEVGAIERRHVAVTLHEIPCLQDDAVRPQRRRHWDDPRRDS